MAPGAACADDAVLYVSPAYETIWGRARQSLYDSCQTFRDALHPDDRERVTRAMDGQHQTGGYDEEYHMVRPDGEMRWVWVRSYPVRNEQGEVIRFAAIAEDISECKALEDDRARLAAIVEYSDDAIVSMSLNGDVISWNAGAERQYGYTHEEMIGRPISAWNRFGRENGAPGDRVGIGVNYLHLCDTVAGPCAEEAPAVASGLRAVLAGQSEEFHLEYPCHGPREQRWFILRITRFGGGGAARVVMAHENITRRKRAEIGLIEETARRRALFEQSPDGILILDPQSMRFLEFNAAAHQHLGYSREEFARLTLSVVDATMTEEEARAKVAQVKIGQDADIETRQRTKSGEIRNVHVSAQILNVLGRSVYHCIWRDITERKRLEERLLQTQKLETIGRLAGGVAHEFNSILTTIIGQSELLLGGLPADGPPAGRAREIRRAADRAAALTRQLLAYGRRQLLQPEILDLNALLAGMDGMLRHIVGGAVDVRLVPAAGLLAVRADAAQLEQVIMNVAMNAADAMPSSGRLTLETTNITLDEDYVGQHPDVKAGRYVMLAIADTGVGMSEDVKARVFEPFFSTKGAGPGTGLGLSSCYGIIRQSGGHIGVQSEPGRGTTLTLYLPALAQDEGAGAEPSAAHAWPRGTETVLLVEEDPALREMAATLLRRLGYAAVAVAHGLEALALKGRPGIGIIDLLIADASMPQMSGAELSERLRLLYPNMRTLFTCSATDRTAGQPGAAHLQKPYTPAALARKVRKALEAPKAPGPGASHMEVGGIGLA